MSKIGLYSIKDTKACFFRNIFPAQHTSEAVRALTTTINTGADRGNDIALYPKDFDLYFLGTLDQDTGKIDTLDSPEFIVGGASLVRWTGQMEQGSPQGQMHPGEKTKVYERRIHARDEQGRLNLDPKDAGIN